MTQPDFEIRSRAELTAALSVAAQVEHVVLVEYLYAAFSCRATYDATLPPPVQLTPWELARDLYAIAHDEMDHLGTVQQLLAALGAPPVPDAWSFPVVDPLLTFPCELTRLDLDAVDRFVRTESPEAPAPTVRLVEPPDPVRFDVLGDLYRAIVAGLRLPGDAAFIGAPVVGPAPSALTFRPRGTPVATPAQAIATIETVITEGEGSSGADPRGHWQRFAGMRARLERLGAAAEGVSWPCVRNPVLRDAARRAARCSPTRSRRPTSPTAPTGRCGCCWAAPTSRLVGDRPAGDRRPAPGAARPVDARRAVVMATVVRPLGEVLARLPAFRDQPAGPTAGMCFEQYGEFRVPAQPDARLAASLDELSAIAADLEAVAAGPALSALWAGARLTALAGDVRTIRNRLRGAVPAPPRNTFEPATSGRWLSVDFAGWYQARLATGGDPYNDPRGVSGWQFAFPGEPDLDRVLRFQPAGTFLRPHVDPGISVGVRVDLAAVDGARVPALTGASVDLLGSPRFEGHNGVVAADGDEPIVPLRLRIEAGGVARPAPPARAARTGHRSRRRPDAGAGAARRAGAGAAAGRPGRRHRRGRAPDAALPARAGGPAVVAVRRGRRLADAAGRVRRLGAAARRGSRPGSRLAVVAGAGVDRLRPGRRVCAGRRRAARAGDVRPRPAALADVPAGRPGARPPAGDAVDAMGVRVGR